MFYPNRVLLFTFSDIVLVKPLYFACDMHVTLSKTYLFPHHQYTFISLATRK